MATADTQIANMALAHLGNSVQIATLTEKSNEGRACSLFYETCRDAVLRAFPWPFASRRVTLQVVATNPNVDYAFSYRVPSDALTVQYVPSGIDRYPSRATGWCSSLAFGVYPAVPIPFRLGADAGGQLLFTDLENATLVYTVRVTDPTQFPADFVQAFALKLAGDIAPMVTGGDPFKRGVLALQRYEEAIGDARSAAANEEGRDPPPDSQLVTSRY